MVVDGESRFLMRTAQRILHPDDPWRKMVFYCDSPSGERRPKAGAYIDCLLVVAAVDAALVAVKVPISGLCVVSPVRPIGLNLPLGAILERQ